MPTRTRGPRHSSVPASLRCSAHEGWSRTGAGQSQERSAGCKLAANWRAQYEESNSKLEKLREEKKPIIKLMTAATPSK